MEKLRCVFMGTPEFALGPLEALAAAPDVQVVCALTRPDAVSGRGKALVPSPVAAWCDEHGIPVLKTKTVRTSEVQDYLRAAEADFFCVAAYGAILPREVIDMPRLGCLNVHASVLPQGRGAAPMQRALLTGGEPLGFSVMRIEEGLDSGPYCRQGTVDAGERTYAEVSEEISRLGGAALVEVLGELAAGIDPGWVEQDDALATHADKLQKSEVLLSPADAAACNMRRVQASSAAAPARCTVDGRAATVCRAHVLTSEELGLLDVACDRGEVVVWRKRLLLGCASGILEVLEVKPDGKRCMLGNEFAASVRGKRGVWEAL